MYEDNAFNVDNDFECMIIEFQCRHALNFSVDIVYNPSN